MRGRKRNKFGRKLTKKCFFFKNKLQVVVVVDVVVVVVVVVIGLTSVARFRHVSKRSENYSNVFNMLTFCCFIFLCNTKFTIRVRGWGAGMELSGTLLRENKLQNQ